MALLAPDSETLTLHDEHGQLIAYLVPTKQMNRMQAEIEDLRMQVATLQRQGAVSQEPLDPDACCVVVEKRLE
ncbi:hypothetical protein [Gemmata sp.]|uniref:hypothetical protein n=1 Tax=Gemmata sp. TaxID=1914242 RepID=UPI003F6F9E2D